jgi:hypothetical protein
MSRTLAAAADRERQIDEALLPLAQGSRFSGFSSEGLESPPQLGLLLCDLPGCTGEFDFGRIADLAGLAHALFSSAISLIASVIQINDHARPM